MIAATAISIGLLTTPPVDARTSLLGEDGTVRRVALLGIEDGLVVSMTPAGLLRREPWSDSLLAWRTDLEPPTSRTVLITLREEMDDRGEGDAAAGMLRLTDGRVWIGTPLDAPDPDTLAWMIEGVGAATVPIEDVSTIEFLTFDAQTYERGTDPLPDDVVLLMNGDRLRGFVERIGTTVVVDAGNGSLELPVSKVARIDLATEPGAPGGSMVHLTDGSVHRAVSFARGGQDRIRLRLSSAASSEDPTPSDGDRASNMTGGALSREIVAASVLAVRFDAARVHSLSVAGTRPVGLEPWREAPAWFGAAHDPLGWPDLDLPGPTVLRLDLPERSERMLARAVLPPSQFEWGDAELVVRVDGREVERVRVRGDAPTADLDVPLLDARVLELRVEPGARGPIQDRVVLERPVLILRDP